MERSLSPSREKGFFDTVICIQPPSRYLCMITSRMLIIILWLKFFMSVFSSLKILTEPEKVHTPVLHSGQVTHFFSFAWRMSIGTAICVLLSAPANIVWSNREMQMIFLILQNIFKMYDFKHFQGCRMPDS